MAKDNKSIVAIPPEVTAQITDLLNQANERCPATLCDAAHQRGKKNHGKNE